MLRTLTDVEDCRNLPVSHFLCCRHFARFTFHRLTHCQRDARAGLGNVFAQHQYRIVRFDFAQSRRINAAFTQHFQRQLQTFLLTVSDTGVEVFFAHQLTQRKVAFHAGTRRTDADHFLRLTQNICCALHCLFGIEGNEIIATTLYWLTRTIFQVDVTVTETTTVAEEVVVYCTVVTVFDSTQFAITLAGADVTADGTLLADARRKLHIPFTVVTLGVRFVGKYAGRANFDQVTGKFAFQRAVFRATEVDVVVCTVNAQVRAVSVIFVVTHAAVAGDAAVHFVRDEWPQILITVGTFGETVATEAVSGHHGHILKMAVTAFFTYRTIVRVVGH